MKLLNKDYLLMVYGNAISAIGDILYTAAISYWVYQKTQSNSVVACTSSITMLVLAVGLPLTGSLADRHKRRFAIISMDAFRGLIMLALGCIGLFSQLSIPLIIVSTILMSLCATVYKPFSNLAFLSFIPRDEIVRGQSISAAIKTTCSIGGKALCGILIGMIGVPFVILLNGISYILVAVLECFLNESYPPVKESGKQDNSLFRNTIRGFKSIAGNEKVLFISFLYVLFCLFFTGISSLLITFILENGFDINEYGYVLSAMSMGSLASTLLLSIRKISLKE